MLSTLVALTGGAALAGALSLQVALLIDWPSRRRRDREKPDQLLL